MDDKLCSVFFILLRIAFPIAFCSSCFLPPFLALSLLTHSLHISDVVNPTISSNKNKIKLTYEEFHS